MSKVEITFKIEVDDNVLINHQIKQDYVTSFQKERDLAEEVINKLFSHNEKTVPRTFRVARKKSF